jgi:hypothetical protein
MYLMFEQICEFILKTEICLHSSDRKQDEYIHSFIERHQRKWKKYDEDGCAQTYVRKQRTS